MLEHNEMYKSRGWVWNDPDVIPIEPDNNLYYLIQKISKMLAGTKTLFLIDDIISNEALDKRRQPLLGLAISGNHRQHSLWLLTQSTLLFQRISGDKQKCFTFGIQKTEQI